MVVACDCGPAFVHCGDGRLVERARAVDAWPTGVAA
jgi:hypothetical protein